MPLLCKLGRHSAVRMDVLMDPADMKQKSHCKRCGAPMVREPERGWRLQQPAPANPAIHQGRRIG